MNRYEKQKAAVEKAIAGEIAAYKAIYTKADDEDRDPTDDERLEIETHLKAIETLKKERSEAEGNIETLKRVDDLGRELGPAVPALDVQMGRSPHEQWADAMNKANKSLGETFVESKGYKDAIDEYRQRGGSFREGFSIPSVALEAKGTLLEGPGGGGGALGVTVPQVIPGVVSTLFRRMVFADLLLDGQATTSSIRYVVEGTATSGAAGVAEGAAKPESTLGLTTADEPVKKIATLLPVSEEMLQDAPQIQSYINGRLSLFVRLEEERQLIRGTSGGNEVQGLLTSRNVPVYAGGTAVGNKAVQLFKAMNGMRGSAFLEADWIALHPGDWEDIRLLTDTAGQFVGGGPFQGPYGNGRVVDQSTQVQGATDTLWNTPVYVTPATGAAKGTAVVGTRESAQVFRRGGLSVDASNSHSTYFALNLVAIRAEERLGLAVYRPTGFVEVRLA
jgi:HK97 family phage major capsid protein